MKLNLKMQTFRDYYFLSLSLSPSIYFTIFYEKKTFFDKQAIIASCDNFRVVMLFVVDLETEKKKICAANGFFFMPQKRCLKGVRDRYGDAFNKKSNRKRDNSDMETMIATK